MLKLKYIRSSASHSHKSRITIRMQNMNAITFHIDDVHSTVLLFFFALRGASMFCNFAYVNFFAIRFTSLGIRVTIIRNFSPTATSKKIIKNTCITCMYLKIMARIQWNGNKSERRREGCRKFACYWYAHRMCWYFSYSLFSSPSLCQNCFQKNTRTWNWVKKVFHRRTTFFI